MVKSLFSGRLVSLLIAGFALSQGAAMAQDEDLSQREHEVMVAWTEYVAEEEGTPLTEIDMPAFDGRVPQEAIARKARSASLLSRRRVPVNATLPVIETVAQSRRLTSRAVAERALALMIVTIKADTRDDTFAAEVMEAYGAEAYLSPQEREYVFTTAATENDHLQNVWRYEALYTLLWALGFTDELGHPDEVSNVEWTAQTLLELGPDGFFAQARLRNQSALLDQADLIYRYHWAAREAADASSVMPAGVDRSVIIERHYALNWLIGYLDQDWDEISTDT